MKRLLAIIAFILANQVFADELSQNVYHEINVSNGEVILKNIPFSKYGDIGLYQVLRGSDSTVLYQGNKFLQYENYFLKSGQYHVQINDWVNQHDKDEVVLYFYHQDQLIKEYNIKDLPIDLNKQTFTVSHIVWESESFIIDNTIQIITESSEVLKFNVINGELIESKLIVNENELVALRQTRVAHEYICDFQSPYLNSLKLDSGHYLDSVLKKIVFNYIPDDFYKIWIIVEFNDNGEIEFPKNWSYNDYELSQNDLIELKKEVGSVRLVNIEFPPSYIKWQEGILIEKTEPNKK